MDRIGCLEKLVEPRGGRLGCGTLFCAKLLPKLGTGNRMLRNTLNLVGNIN
jgi:hypothetical protein